MMRKLAPVILLFFLASCVSHPADCSPFRNGKFKAVANGHVFYIERNGSFQKEYVGGAKDSALMTFNVKWLNDYTYTIQLTPESHKKYPTIPKDAMMTIEIIKTTPRTYVERTTPNFMTKTVVAKYTKID